MAVGLRDTEAAGWMALEESKEKVKVIEDFFFSACAGGLSTEGRCRSFDTRTHLRCTSNSCVPDIPLVLARHPRRFDRPLSTWATR